MPDANAFWGFIFSSVNNKEMKELLYVLVSEKAVPTVVSEWKQLLRR